MIPVLIAAVLFGSAVLTTAVFQIKGYFELLGRQRPATSSESAEDHELRQRDVRKRYRAGAVGAMVAVTLLAGILMFPVAFFTNWHYVGKDRIGLVTVGSEVRQISEGSYFYFSWNPVRDIHQIHMGESTQTFSASDILQQHAIANSPWLEDIKVTWQVRDDAVETKEQVKEIFELYRRDTQAGNINEALWTNEVAVVVRHAAEECRNDRDCIIRTANTETGLVEILNVEHVYGN